MHKISIIDNQVYFYIDGMNNIPNDAINITEQQYLEAAAHVNSGGEIEIINGQVTLKEIVKDLDTLKQEKATESNYLTQQTIYAGYNSDALGTTHHYPALDRDQANMIASVTDSYNPTNPTGWTTPFWCRDSNGVWGFREHTAAQIQQAGKDGKQAITTAVQQNASNQVLIAAAETIEELNALNLA